MNRIRGLDTIRFICALVVTIGHVGLKELDAESSHRLLHLVLGSIRGVINGPAAVIVFFLISGFCIHFPNRDGKPLLLLSFYSRRLLRLVLPLLAALLLAVIVNSKPLLDPQGIVWSLVAELIYYLVYPFLLAMSSRWGWKPLIAAAFALSAGVILIFNPTVGDYPEFGHGLNWVVGLPCWMLGCLLAQQVHLLKPTSSLHLWGYRALVVAISTLTMILRWHIPGFSIGFPWSLTAFSLVAYLWLAQEIAFYNVHKPSPAKEHKPLPFLEAAGVWSYSLYLMHLPAFTIMSRWLPVKNYVVGQPLLGNEQFLINIVAALPLAYLFYLLIERPSHLIAVQVSSYLKRKAGDKQDAWLVLRHAKAGASGAE